MAVKRPPSAPGVGSTAARCDERPVRIYGASVACKSPVVGLLDRIDGIAVDDTPVHSPRHIDLVRDRLERQLRNMPGQLSLDDVHSVELFDAGLQRLLGGDTLERATSFE